MEGLLPIFPTERPSHLPGANKIVPKFGTLANGEAKTETCVTLAL